MDDYSYPDTYVNQIPTIRQRLRGKVGLAHPEGDRAPRSMSESTTIGTAYIRREIEDRYGLQIPFFGSVYTAAWQAVAMQSLIV